MDLFNAYCLAALVGYLLGALPFGFLVAKGKGVNIFEVGSKSPGATNVRRVLGRGPGNLVFLLDALKGAAASGWPLLAFEGKGYVFWQFGMATPFGFVHFNFSQPVEMAVVGLIAALVGHSYSLFTKFRGGKGVATTAGGLLVLMPCVLAGALATWLVTFRLSRYVSLASILAALAAPLAAFFLGEPPILLGLATLIAVFVTLRHRANIVRLLNGTENKFVKKPATPETSRT